MSSRLQAEAASTGFGEPELLCLLVEASGFLMATETTLFKFAGAEEQTRSGEPLKASGICLITSALAVPSTSWSREELTERDLLWARRTETVEEI